MEKQEGKFPVNSASVAGVIQRIYQDKKNNRINATIMSNDGGSSSRSKFINVYISGKEKCTAFMKQYTASLKELGTKPGTGEKEGQEVPIKPCMHVTGPAHFNTFKNKEGNTNQSYSLIASGEFKKSDTFWLTANADEMKAFRQEFNQNNSKVNDVEMRVRLAAPPEVKEYTEQSSGETKTFMVVNVAHNYKDDNESKKTGEDVYKSMWANLVIPNSKLSEMKALNLEKGSPILLTASVQPKRYKNSDGKSIDTFSLISKSMHMDMSKTVELKTATNAIDKVAEKTKKAERVKEADKQKTQMKR